MFGPLVQTTPYKLQKVRLVLKQGMLRDCIAKPAADFLLLLILTSTHICLIITAIGLLMFSTLSPCLKVFLNFAVHQRFRL